MKTTKKRTKKSATVAENCPSEDELLAALTCLQLPLPTKSSPEHQCISFVEAHNSLIDVLDRTSSWGQWRAGQVLTLLYELWHPKYGATLKERTTLSERSALNFRDMARWVSEKEAKEHPPSVLYERIAGLKQLLRTGLTRDTLPQKCKEIETKSLALRQLCETDDRFALKTFFDEPADAIRAIEKCLPIISGCSSNAISIGKALQKFCKDLKKLTK